MNSDVFLWSIEELNKTITKIKEQNEERNRWKSNSWYENDFEHDYGYEPNYHNPYHSQQFPHPCNKISPINYIESISKHQTRPRPCNQSNWLNDSCNPVRHSNQIPSREDKVIGTQAKPSPSDFFEMHEAPHPMPKDYI